MCTAATYKTKDFYFGRTFDYEISLWRPSSDHLQETISLTCETVLR